MVAGKVARRLDRKQLRQEASAAMAQKGTSVNRIRLTQEVVEGAIKRHQRGERVRLWDDGNAKGGVAELYLRITPAGSAAYYLRFVKPGGGKSDAAIGKAKRIPIEQARAKARQMLLALELNGVDPVENKRAEEKRAKARRVETFKALVDEYLAAPPKRPRSKKTMEELRWRFDKYVLPLIGKRPYRELTRRDIRETVKGVWKAAGGNGEDRTGNRIANMCHADIRAAFNWAMDEDMAEANPAMFSKLFDDRPVKRVGKLTDDMLRTLWRTFEEEKVRGWGDASVLGIQLCLVTLQRPNEVAHAHRDDVDLKAGVWRIHPDRNKTDQWYEVPLTALAVELFEDAFRRHNSAWAFPAKDNPATSTPSKSKARREIDQNIGEGTLSQRWDKTRRRLVKAKKLATNDVQLYDARRFGRTCLVQRLLIPTHVAERVINHAPDRSIKAVYDVGEYSAEVRKAQEAWTAELLRIVSATPEHASIDCADQRDEDSKARANSVAAE
jgi:integrase